MPYTKKKTKRKGKTKTKTKTKEKKRIVNFLNVKVVIQFLQVQRVKLLFQFILNIKYCCPLNTFNEYNVRIK